MQNRVGIFNVIEEKAKGDSKEYETEVKELKKRALFKFDCKEASLQDMEDIGYIFSLIHDELNSKLGLLNYFPKCFISYCDLSESKKLIFDFLGNEDAQFSEQALKNNFNELIKTLYDSLDLNSLMERFKARLLENPSKDVIYNFEKKLFSFNTQDCGDIELFCRKQDLSDIGLARAYRFAAIKEKLSQSLENETTMEEVKTYFSKAIEILKTILTASPEILVCNNVDFGKGENFITKAFKENKALYPYYEVHFKWPNELQLNNCVKFFATNLLFRTGLSGKLGCDALFYLQPQNNVVIKKVETNGKEDYSFSVLIPVLSEKGLDDFFNNRDSFSECKNKLIQRLKLNKGDFEDYKNKKFEENSKFFDNISEEARANLKNKQGYGIEEIKNMQFNDFIKALETIEVSPNGIKIWPKGSSLKEIFSLA